MDAFEPMLKEHPWFHPRGMNTNQPNLSEKKVRKVQGVFFKVFFAGMDAFN